MAGTGPARPRVPRTIRGALSPTARLLTLGDLVLLAAVVLLGAGAEQLHVAADPFRLSVVTVAAAFFLSELLVFHVEVDRDPHTFALSEIPLVVALFFASPAALIAGRLLGATVILVWREHQGPTKLAFNLSLFTTECIVALSVFHGFGASTRGIDDPVAWLVTLGAVAAADLVSIACVSLAIRVHHGRPDLRALLVMGAATAVVNTTLALSIVLVLSANPVSAVLLAVLVGVLYLAYRGYADLRRRHESLEMLYEFTRLVGESLQAESILELILGEARRVLHADAAAIELIEPGDRATVIRLAARGAGAVRRPDDRHELLPPHVRDRVLHDGAVLLVADGSHDNPDRAVLRAFGVRDCIVAPLVIGDDVLGLIAVGDRLSEISTFDRDDADLLARLGRHAAVALQNGRFVERLRQEAVERRYQALHDSLTGLPNRALLFERISQTLAHRRGSPLAVLLMDLDRFKEVNDTLGHHTGDLLLQDVASRVTAMVPSGATTARLGGDEFAILLPEVASEDDAVHVAHRVQQELSRPFEVDGIALDVVASIGISFGPTHGTDPSSVLKSADIAMYTAKASGVGIEVYDAMRDDHSPARLVIGTELRAAIAAEELEVYFQPQARLSDGELVGAEALVRWKHPERGWLSPDSFVPIAEQSGLVGALTAQVLDRALAECRRWQAEGFAIPVSVNVALRSLIDRDFPGDLLDALAIHDVAPERLVLEITESSVMADQHRTLEVLEALARLGVRLSIDDFGTGYSSMTRLQRVCVHEIKIDKSFVLQMCDVPGDAAIVRSVIDLAENLGLRVVAEGVEDQRTWDHLAALGCHVAQGYMLSRPLSSERFLAWLRARAARTHDPAALALAVPLRRLGRLG